MAVWTLVDQDTGLARVYTVSDWNLGETLGIGNRREIVAPSFGTRCASMEKICQREREEEVARGEV
jgi:hypothetical protein